MKKLVLIFAALISVCSLSAQEFTPTWKLDYTWLFDNREYKSDYAISQTIFGSRLSPELGLEWGGNNSINIGAQIFTSMGSSEFFDPSSMPLVYYNYSDEKYNFAAGIVPRSKMMGDYPTAFFCDSTLYYNPVIQGGIANYKGENGYIELCFSWVGLLATDVREEFMIFSSAEVQKGKFKAGYYLNMVHYAMYKDSTGVVDNILAMPYVGMNLGKVGGVFDKASFRVGGLLSIQRDRKYDDERYPAGLYVDLSLEKWNLGIENSFYIGDNLMPYYDGHPGDYYGSALYYGDPFYRSGDIYNRLEIFWNAVNTSRVNLRVESVHHYDGTSLDWQQVMKLTVKLGGKFQSF